MGHDSLREWGQAGSRRRGPFCIGRKGMPHSKMGEIHCLVPRSCLFVLHCAFYVHPSFPFLIICFSRSQPETAPVNAPMLGSLVYHNYQGQKLEEKKKKKKKSCKCHSSGVVYKVSLLALSLFSICLAFRKWILSCLRFWMSF